MGFLFFVRTDQCGIPRISGNAGKYADMAELADAPDLGSGVHDVQVQVLLSAPEGANLNTGRRALHFFKKVVAVVVKFSK